MTRDGADVADLAMNLSRLRTANRKSCRGFSTLSAMFWLALLVSGMYLFFKVLPAVNESFSVRKAIRSIEASGPATPLEVINAFDRQKVVDGIVSLNGRDLEITREEGVLVISYAYDRKIPLVGGVSLLIRYEGTTRKGAL